MSELEYSSYSEEEMASKESDVIGIELEENEVSVFDEKGQVVNLEADKKNKRLSI